MGSRKDGYYGPGEADLVKGMAVMFIVVTAVIVSIILICIGIEPAVIVGAVIFMVAFSVLLTIGLLGEINQR